MGLRLLVINWQDRLNPQAGGAEIHLHEIFGRLAGRGHRVTVLASGWRGAPARAEVDGLQVHRVGGRYTFNLAAPRYVRRSLAGENFDVVVEDLNKVPLFTPYWSDSRVVLLVHHLFGGTAFQEAPAPIAAATWLLERPLARVYRGLEVQAISQSTKQDLVRRGFAPERIRVIPNGVDTEFFRPDASVPRAPEPTALYLGRLKRYKRVDLILRAAARLRQDGLPLRLTIAGRGDDGPRLRALADELGLADVAEFAGYVSEEEKRRLMRTAWVHVLTSSKEGWGISNLEAAACGTPTVASDSPGLRDSVRDGATGYLVPHGDVAALADRLRRVLTDTGHRDRLGEQARAFALEHTWRRAAEETERHLTAVASGATPIGREAGPPPSSGDRP